MAWGEAARWRCAAPQATFYRDRLARSADRAERDGRREKIVKPAGMPWEMAPQGILKHLVNAGMNVRVDSVDVYMQVVPPAGRSGRHRHLAEECLYVLEGFGYDLHWDCDIDVDGDRWCWRAQEAPKRFDYRAGDVVYIPPNTIHQHFNADPGRRLRFLSTTNRIYDHYGLNDLEQIEAAPGYAPGAAVDETLLARLGL